MPGSAITVAAALGVDVEDELPDQLFLSLLAEEAEKGEGKPEEISAAEEIPAAEETPPAAAEAAVGSLSGGVAEF